MLKVEQAKGIAGWVFWIKVGELASALAEFAGSQVGGQHGSNEVSSSAGRRSWWATRKKAKGWGTDGLGRVESREILFLRQVLNEKVA
jgi:hypothetical protein